MSENYTDAELEHYRDVHLEAVLEKYRINGHPGDLAQYLEEGGEVSKSLRQDIVEFLRERPIKGKGDAYDDLETFSWISTTLKADPDVKTLEAAYEKYVKGKNLTPRGAKDRYERGKKISQEFGFTD
jgi:hypothetical protein